MTPVEAERLAYAVNALRPDWPRTSLQTLLASKLGNRAYRDAAVALVFVALDPATSTPARVLENGPWWGATLTAASQADRHPASKPFVPPDEPCDICMRTRPDCEARSNGTHDYRPRQEFKRRGAYANGVAKARAAIGAALPPTTDTSTDNAEEA